MLLHPQNSSSPTLHARRSQRKTKSIVHHHFPSYSIKHNHSKHNKQTASDSDSSQEVQEYCAKLMEVNSRAHESFLLVEMGKAFRVQSDKLFDLCKIKLKLEEPIVQPLPVSSHSPLLIESMEDLLECLSGQSSESQGQLTPYNRLQRAESAKMLCDNYQNNQLIYSVETLTPRLAKEDMEFKFMEELP